MPESATKALLSPLPPTEAEQAAWDRLTRDEQLAAYKDHLSHPNCDRVSKSTMAEILAAARAAVRARG